MLNRLVQKVFTGVFRLLFVGMFLAIYLTGVVYMGIVGYYLVS